MASATRLTINMPERSVTVKVPAPPRFQVISHGVQGPPGTLPPEVLEQLKGGGQAAHQLGVMMNSLTDAFSYHGGMIAAQEDKTP